MACRYGVQTTIGVLPRLLLVGRNLVVHERVVRTPVPHGDDGIPFDALWPRRRNRGFTLADAIGPFGEHLQCEGTIQTARCAAHAAAANAGLEAIVPRFHRGFE